MSRLPLTRHELQATFAYRRGESLTTAAFLSEVAALAAALPDRPYVVNLCADRYRFTVGFAAALVRGQTTLMPASQTSDFLARLEQGYPGLHQLTDESFDALPACAPASAVPAISS